MAKISPVAAKYIVHATINIEGVVDKPDVIGAIFGQTEGLLGADLELRELQRSGRIGRIEVDTNTMGGKTMGEIIIPSSLDRTETAIVAASLEIIQRIGPCNAKVEVTRMEDIRVSKRTQVIERAKALLRGLMDSALPDSQELADEVSQSVRVMEIMEYGRERLPAGPAVEESDEVIVVEGRADVLNLLKHGIKNAIAINGTSVPQTIKDLSKRKTLVVFVDGDRGGDLIIRELLAVADIDFVCKAANGTEVEEITKKEIHKALRGRITAEQAKLELNITTTDESPRTNGEERKVFSSPAAAQPFTKKPGFTIGGFTRQAMPTMHSTIQNSAPVAAPAAAPVKKESLQLKDKAKLKSTLDNLFGTRGACLLDDKLNVLGKVPRMELATTIKTLGNVSGIVIDGTVDKELIKIAETSNVSYVVGSDVRSRESTKVTILSDEDLATL
ncbi:MAG TPA: DNA primase DnaG [Candidatus Nanoarchaeia archaeon]|nr:DNA primase DnaG [Candidatus Nanoarchaeia archaeon]